MDIPRLFSSFLIREMLRLLTVHSLLQEQIERAIITLIEISIEINKWQSFTCCGPGEVKTAALDRSRNSFKLHKLLPREHL